MSFFYVEEYTFHGKIEYKTESFDPRSLNSWNLRKDRIIKIREVNDDKADWTLAQLKKIFDGS